jgi:hypothetical protein
MANETGLAKGATEVMRGWPTALSVPGQASPSIPSIPGGTSAAARALGQLGAAGSAHHCSMAAGIKRFTQGPAQEPVKEPR